MDARDSLLTDLYGSILEPETFLPTLTRINRWLDCDGVHVVGWDRAVGNMMVSMIVGDHLHALEEKYRHSPHFQKIDPRTSLPLARTPGVCIACHDFFDNKFVGRDEFYQDLLLPHGPRYVLGGNIFHDERRDIMVAFNHLIGRPEFSKEKRDQVGALLPHLMKWSSMMMQAAKLRAAMSAGFHALQSLEQGVIAFDDRLRVIYANTVADSILGLGLIRSGLGLDVPIGLGAEQRIQRVYTSRRSETFAAIQSRNGQTIKLLVSVFAIPPDGNGNHVLPVGLGGMSAIPSVATTGESLFNSLSRPNVMVLLRRADEAKPLGAEHLRQMFGLTPAEARLGEALAKGTTTQEFSDQNQVSINTIRTQVRALLSKTGARNLTGLVRLLAGLPGVM
ncbi:helix-turn-helix transcriptional regulator [Dyella sp. 20L07]|uniref:helix-turn-helix transcriptional regulator n=1 Tax=Dyella sp. 20L07 TaxID=3384240 RepID=UPI003D2E48CD